MCFKRFLRYGNFAYSEYFCSRLLWASSRRLARKMRTRIQSAKRFGREDERIGHQRMKKAPHSRCFILWWPIRESNPSFQRERLASWPLDQWAIALCLNIIPQRAAHCKCFFNFLALFVRFLSFVQKWMDFNAVFRQNRQNKDSCFIFCISKTMLSLVSLAKMNQWLIKNFFFSCQLMADMI